MWYRCNLAAQEAGLECTCVNNSDFTVLVSGGSRCCWVSMYIIMQLSHSKWLSEWNNKSASNFALILHIPPWKLFGWFGRPWRWTTGNWQLHHDNTSTHISCLMQGFFLRNIKSPRWLSPPTAQFEALWLLAFPQTKITFEREEISDHWWDSGKYDVAADGDWENCVRPKVPTLKRTEASLSYVQCFLYLVSSSINVSIFHIIGLHTFWTYLVFRVL